MLLFDVRKVGENMAKHNDDITLNSNGKGMREK
jgi:hypothetical protein